MTQTRRKNFQHKRTSINFARKPFLQEQLDDTSKINYERLEAISSTYTLIPESINHPVLPYNATSATIKYKLRGSFIYKDGSTRTVITEYTQLVRFAQNLTDEDVERTGTFIKNGTEVNWAVTLKKPSFNPYIAGDGIDISANDNGDNVISLKLNDISGILKVNEGGLYLDLTRLKAYLSGNLDFDDGDYREHWGSFDDETDSEGITNTSDDDGLIVPDDEENFY